MAVWIGKELPEDALKLLGPGDQTAKKQKVVQVVTVDEEGWPNAGMLSYYDIVAKDQTHLRLATWADGECARDLKRNGRLAMLIIDKEMTYYVKASARELPGAGEGLSDLNNQGGASPVAIFDVKVEGVFEDKIPTARVLTGVLFEGSEVEDQAHQGIFRELLGP
jgi:hypothetical protein